MVQAHIFYSGTVQGVGFRYTTQRVDVSQGLSGWVKNLKDGRVEIIAEGENNHIEQLIDELDKQFDGYIRHKEIDLCPAEGQCRGFRIAH